MSANFYSDPLFHDLGKTVHFLNERLGLSVRDGKRVRFENVAVADPLGQCFGESETLHALGHLLRIIPGPGTEDHAASAMNRIRVASLTGAAGSFLAKRFFAGRSDFAANLGVG